MRAIRDRHWFTGHAVGVSNPMAFVIIGVVLPQFVDGTWGHLGLIAVPNGLLSDSLWAVIASQLLSRFLTADAYNRTRVQPAQIDADTPGPWNARVSR